MYETASRGAGHGGSVSRITAGSGAAGFTQRYGERITVRPFGGDPTRLTEMDAVVAYLQSLGRLTTAPYAAH